MIKCTHFYVFLLLCSVTVCLVECANEHSLLRLNSEPVSQLSRADGSRVQFKCSASPPQATIKWLRNGVVMKAEQEPEWIKMHSNKLVLKLQRSSHGNTSELLSGLPFTPPPNETYQCLAELNGQVIVSQPAKLIIAQLNSFEHQSNHTLIVVAGNTAVIPCQLPYSMPAAISEFEFNNITIARSYDRYRLVPSGSLQIFNAKPSDSGAYRCVAHNPFLQEKVYADYFVILKVIKPRHAQMADKLQLHFVVSPKETTGVILGQNITIECVASGHPTPKIIWSKVHGDLPKSRSMVDGGNLHITTLEKDDEGIYTCTASNSKSTITTNTNLEIFEIPQIGNNDPYEEVFIDEGQDYDLLCEANGTPKPFITWLHNGFEIDLNEVPRDTYVFTPGSPTIKIVKASQNLHGGIYQCFATNTLGSTYSIKIVNVRSPIDTTSNGNSNRVDPSSSSSSSSSSTQTSASVYRGGNAKHRNVHEHKLSRESSEKGNVFIDHDRDLDESAAHEEANGNHHHHHHHHNNHKGQNKKGKHSKNAKLIPPHNPIVNKINDDSVMVRWTVPKNSGVPISFFKLQYQQRGNTNGEVITIDEDIPAHIFAYQVGGLMGNTKYRFRIAAVYVNDDNAKSGWTKFSFPKNPSIGKPSLPPTIMGATAQSSNEISLHWELLNIDSTPIDGFFIYYRASDSAGEYLKVTAPGSDIRQHNIAHLSPGMTYELKMRCFNPSGTSDFSNIYTVKTLPSKEVTTVEPKEDIAELPPTRVDPSILFNLDQNLILILILAIGAFFSVLVCCVICLIRCKNQVPASKVIKKNEKPIKSTSPSDYYFNNTNMYDRRTNGHLGSSNGVSASRNSLRQTSNNETEANESKPLNMRINPLQNEMSSLNRRNSFRNSMSSSMHHLYTGNGKPFDYHNPHQQEATSTTSTLTPIMSNGTTIQPTTATIDRKRMMKSCVDSYLDYPRLNHPSTSFTRLNGTLERKRRSRTDLNTLDRTSYLRHISTTDIDRQTNGTAGSYMPPATNGPIVIMQSSC
ncbi:hypothetical protein RDWZM_001308 [Blomia tropicalis]|uniref:Uncharacterized protein n=1 Tax=Blomia tropicalis TaxID=40697 RepID=A0A9Q0MCV5_BLOTA|nr:hypothetical protein RDWZM_001308 [Blomia tropicalis]